MTKKDIIEFLSDDRIPDDETIILRDAKHNLSPIKAACVYNKQVVLSVSSLNLTPFELKHCVVSVKADSQFYIDFGRTKHIKNDKEGAFTNSEQPSDSR